MIVNLTRLILWFPAPIMPQDMVSETKKMAAMTAALRRLCAPKKASGRLEVSPEIHRQWKAGGAQRKSLLHVLVKCNGDKELQ